MVLPSIQFITAWWCLIAAATPATALPQRSASWQNLSPLPVGVFRAAVSRSGSNVVVTGGITQSGLRSRLVQSLDLTTRTWRVEPGFRVGLSGHAQVTLTDGRVFVTGGITAEPGSRPFPHTACYLIEVDDLTVVEVPRMPFSCKEPTANLLSDGRVLVVGGDGAAVFDADSSEWGPVIPLKEYRSAHDSVTLPGGQVLVAGGVGRSSFELITIGESLGESGHKANGLGGYSRILDHRLPRPLDDLALVNLPDGGVWVLGGQDSKTGDTTDQTWVLRLAEGGKETLAEGPRLGINGGVADHCVVRAGDWYVSVGGESQRRGRDEELSATRLLNPRTLEVSPLPDLTTPHDDAVAVGSDQGVIVFGGYHQTRVAAPDWLGLGSGGGRAGARSRSVDVPVASQVVESLEIDHGKKRAAAR